MTLVILSEAKDLLFVALTPKQVLRFAQNDKFFRIAKRHSTQSRAAVYNSPFYIATFGS